MTEKQSLHAIWATAFALCVLFVTCNGRPNNEPVFSCKMNAPDDTGSITVDVTGSENLPGSTSTPLSINDVITLEKNPNNGASLNADAVDPTPTGE